MPSFVDDALCVRHWDWSETSQTVSVFTREHGLLRGLAKGAKREKGAFCGGFEVLTRGELGAIVKASGGLATLTSWDLRETFSGFRRSLRAQYAALYVADLVQSMLTEEDPHPELYDRTIWALRCLDHAGRLGGNGAAVADQARVLAVYQLALLEETGYRPELGVDVRRGEELRPAAVYGFSPLYGGLVEDVDGGGGGSGGGEAWRVRAETVELLRRLQAEALEGLEDPEAEAPEPGDDEHHVGFESLWRANRLLASYIREKLGSEPRSLPGLLEVFPGGGDGGRQGGLGGAGAVGGAEGVKEVGEGE